MHDLTHEELAFIGNVLGQLTFKAGSSNQVVMCENIIEKIKVALPQPEPKENEGA